MLFLGTSVFVCQNHCRDKVFKPCPPWCRGRGQVNPTDLFTRLLAGVVYTGLAPASFYEDPRSPHAHFDGM